MSLNTTLEMQNVIDRQFIIKTIKIGLFFEAITRIVLVPKKKSKL